MKNHNQAVLKIVFLLIMFFISINAQSVERRTPTEDYKATNNNQPIDIDSKAEELGITTGQLNGILNSAANNGGGDPQPEAIQERFFSGQSTGDQFGISVSTAGDVNGDGYDDLIVGAQLNDAGGSDAGRAYIYFGGPSMDNVADVIMTGEAASNAFGYSVSTAGDVNGDGYSDVIVGAYGYSSFTGRAYIYFGGASMDNVADVIMTGEAASDYFGGSVTTGGDVNGDGYSDVIVGAYRYTAYTGRAYIYFGGASMDNVADVIMTGETNGDQFGASVSTVGDVNGDGYSDVIVGARGYSSNTGRAYIYFGGPSMDSVADVIMTGEAIENVFGISVSTAGDVNGDGYSDVIVGAIGYSSYTGRAYIYFGGASIDNVADVIMTGEATTNEFGSSVSSAGDVNGDGFSDVIVGANSFNNFTGRAYVYFGGEAMDNIKDVIMTGVAEFVGFGSSVSSAGDVNGDGYDDLIVGVPTDDAGRAYLYTNSLTGTDIPDDFFTGEAADDYFGYSVSTARDVNGDGYYDVIVGVYGYSSNTGKAYIYFGGPLMDNVADVTMTGEATSNYFGRSVSSVGDVNEDGYSDVIVGAYGYSSGTGRAYVYFGGESMDNVADVIITGEATGDQLGSSVSTAGDVNGDGYSDVIVGANYFNTFAGRAYIYFGGTSMDNVADIIMTGEATGNQFGISVSTAGDVNGDGYSDVIVGADGYDSATGRAYIYFGGVSMNNLVDVLITGEATGNKLGSSVSTAGDVNGDGYSDVIVGAYQYSITTGRAYIYFGGASVDNVADVIMTGETYVDWFGKSVSDAGDVNGDGYSDVIVGARGYSSSTGRAYIYFGGASMDNVAEVIMTGEATDNYFGISVSTAGDVNGDGYSDVIVGAFGYSSSTGRAYLYLSSSPPINPRIRSVADVPSDQGGYMFVNFVRSGYDARGESNIITEYLIEMSNPPGVDGFSWWQAGTVQPVQNPLYTFIANTPNDSMSNNSGTYYFRVTARTDDPNQYWRSNIMYGHSVDNLAPLAPEAFYANLNGSDVHLGWESNLEEDFRDYYIYRSDTPIADDFTLLTTTTDTTFTDTSSVTGTEYYYVQAYDIHDNGSELTGDSVMALLSANIKVYLEGPYVGGQMSTFLNSSGSIPLDQPFNNTPWNYTGTETVTSIPANVTDWILVELRSDETTVVDRRAAFLKNDGTLVDLDGVSNIKFPTATTGDYYVVITHRNHLSVMTATPVTISFSPTLYDMRSNPANAYGTNSVKDLGDGNYGMISGDANGNGQIQNNDSETYWAVQNGQSGYKEGDYNLNNQVQNNDRETYWVPNNGRGTQVPVGTLLMVKNNNIKNTEVTK